MATTDTLTVDRVAWELLRLDRLEPDVAEHLPARLTTLLRRVVRSLPYALRNILEAVAPPPRRAPADAYAIALLALLRAYDRFGPHRLTGAIERLGNRLDALAAAAGEPPPSSADRRQVVDDAFRWRARALELRPAEQRALAEGHVAMASEGLVRRGDAAMRAAAFLAEDAAKRPDYERAARYADLALRWEEDEHTTASFALADCISILVDAGRYERAVELGAPLVARYDVFDRVDPLDAGHPVGFTVPTVLIGGALAHACSELGRHDEAVALGGQTLWRAIRVWGDDDPMVCSCREVLADCLTRAGRSGDAVAMIRPAFVAQRGRADEQPREYVHLGSKLAAGLATVGALDEARAVSIEVATFASRRLARTDRVLRDAQTVRAHVEHLG